MGKEIHVKETMRDDGTKSIVYGENVNDNGRIVGNHGHIAFTEDGTVDYARTPEQNKDDPNDVIYNSKLDK